MYYKKEVKIDGSFVGKCYPIELSVAIIGFDLKPDCQVGHFGYNFYFRTPYGIKRKSYKNGKTLEKAVEKVLKNKGITVLGWVDKK